MSEIVQSSDAVMLDTELRQIAGEVQTYKWRAADLIIEMEKIHGWKQLGFASKTLWLQSFKDSRSALYEAVKQRKCLPGVPADDLNTLTAKNLKYLPLLPESKRVDVEVMEKAKGSEAEFVAYLNAVHGLHVTAPRKLVVEFEDAGQYEDVSQAIKDYCQRERVGRSQGLWELLQQ